MKKSIKRLPKCTQEELTVLLDLVCKSIGNCQMVILFGSYARGNYVLWDSNIEFGVHTSYQSDYDILVVVTGQIKYVERKLHRITNQYHDLFAGRRHAFPQFVVEHINTVNRNLEISQYFFTDIVKEGVMLYNSGKHELAKPRKLSFKEIRDIAQKEFDELYPYACGLLEGVNKFYLPEKQNKIARPHMCAGAFCMCRRRAMQSGFCARYMIEYAEHSDILDRTYPIVFAKI